MSGEPSKTAVFLGPTLPVAEAKSILRAEYLPPAAMGDVYRLTARAPKSRPQRIALIDGFFERTAAPWHKEILWALEQGIEVYGAASMGALRAAELEPFGMIGVGHIFEDYRDGRLTDDEEVAVIHGPKERSYAPASDAMVNIRRGLATALEAEVLSPATAEALVRLAKGQFYRDRRWDTVLEAGRAAGLPAAEIEALEARVNRARPDAKGDDARALLQRLATTTPPTRPKKPVEKLAKTWFWWRFVEVMGGGRR
ncbi:MAG: TfuA-like protein [Myxococcota bacterium]